MMKKENIKLSEVIKQFNLKVECGEQYLDKEIEGGYVSDLLSDVMAHSKEGYIWITLQGHPNIVAVAVLKELVGIVIINGRQPEEDTIKKARAKKLPIITSTLTAFELTGKLYELGISGTR